MLASALPRAGDRMTARYACDCGPSWLCCCPEPPLVEKHLTAWRATIAHLMAEGTPPAVPLPVLEGLHRRGGYDRALAELAHAAQCPVVST